MIQNHSAVAKLQAMSDAQREAAVAVHVEALHSLGWRWEGRGLVPTIRPKLSAAVASLPQTHERTSLDL
jgi:hypothetical protein